MSSSIPADPTRHFAVWPKRLPRTMATPDMTLWANLDITTRRYPERTAFVFFDRRISFRELHARVEALAGWLQQVAGVQRGDRVPICLQNSPQFVIAFYAILRADAVVVPVNPMNKAAELTHYITDPEARVAVCGGDVASDWIAANASLPQASQLKHLLVSSYSDEMPHAAVAADSTPAAWRTWLSALPGLPGIATRWPDALAAKHVAAPPEASADDMAVLPYTSGTTGLPKGCMHSHRTIMHNVITGPVWSNATHETVSLTVVPMFRWRKWMGLGHFHIFHSINESQS